MFDDIIHLIWVPQWEYRKYLEIRVQEPSLAVGMQCIVAQVAEVARTRGHKPVIECDLV
jgi:hypothetical protein